MNKIVYLFYSFAEFCIHMCVHKGTLTQKLFAWRMEREIYHQLFPHFNREKELGYPFATREEMNRYTDAFAVSEMLRRAEVHIAKLPKAYGESFRYIMHRDISHRLKQYQRLAEQNRPPKHVDPRFVATRAS